jgi:subtilisin family serine protease
MRKTLSAALFASVVLAATAATAATTSTRTEEAKSYVVVLRGSVDSSSVASEQARAHAATVSHVYTTALQGYSARMAPASAARLARDPRVQFVQPDGVVTTSAQDLPTGVNRVDADLSPTAKINGVDERVNVDVAVIDTGIDLDHPDLNVYTQGATNCSTGRSADDGHGHGTHVAGTIGALDNGSGVVGVAPGARLWPVRVLSKQGRGTTSDVVCGIDYVTAHAGEIEVASMSLGGTGTDDGNCGMTNRDAMHAAICRSVAAGVTYVVAAGNESDDAANHVPAAYDEVITVSALADFNGQPGGGAPATCFNDQDDTLADFSNFGADVDLIAPGVCILSTWKGGGYNTISGTSMATPHVSGAAALYKSTHPGASPAEVKGALQAAGTTNWIWPAQDPDGTQEKLLNVAAF